MCAQVCYELRIQGLDPRDSSSAQESTTFMPFFIHSFSKHALSSCNVPDPVLGASDRVEPLPAAQLSAQNRERR